MGLFDFIKKKSPEVSNEKQNIGAHTKQFKEIDHKELKQVFLPTGNPVLDGTLLRIAETEPQYKIDLLKESISLGHEIDPFYLNQSREEGLPYLCECEEEYDLFHDRERFALKGHIEGIEYLILAYQWENIKHPSKVLYWQNQIIKLAQYGNREAQAALCVSAKNKGPFAFDKNKEERVAYFKGLYEAQLFYDATESNPYAQFAVGVHLTAHHSEEKGKWLKLAAEQGLGDAHYYLAKHYESLCYDYDAANFGQIKDEGKLASLKGLAMEHYLQAAKLNNGIMAGYCQNYIAKWYEDGNAYFMQDLSLAKFWYEIAVKNGHEGAKASLDWLERKLSD